MSSKRQAHSNDQSSLGYQGARPAAKSAEIHGQPIAPAKSAQKARIAPPLLTPRDVLQLQRTLGNRAVSRLLASTRSPHQLSPEVQRETLPKVQNIQAQLTFQRGGMTERREASANSVEDRTNWANNNTTHDYPNSSAELHPNKTDISGNLKSRIVQRAVGFEYELDSSYVVSKVTKEKKKTLGLFGTSEPSKPIVKLKKGYVIADFGTFDVSIDSTPEGFDVEIRIKEVDHISPDSLNGLQATVYQVLAILNKLQKNKKPISGQVIDGDPDILIGGDFSSGSLQATTGLSLTALHAFLSGEMGEMHVDRQKTIKNEDQTVKAYYTRQYGKGSVLLLQKALEHVNILFPKLSDGAKEQLAAVIASILTIPVTARDNKLPYAKSATTLLARSDYATVFNELPAVVLMNKDRLKFLIMTTLNTYLALKEIQQVALDSRVYPKNSIKESQGLSLTIGEWLDGLLPASGTLSDTKTSKDLLSDDNYPKDKYQNDDFSQLESLGGYGSKTDKGENSKKLPIFEFRKYLKVSDEHLPLVIEGIWELVHEANKKK